MHFLRSIIVPLALLGATLGFSLDAAAQKPAAAVTLRLDWKPGAQHAPFYYAREMGYYAAEGIDLQIISGSGSSDSVKQLGSKAVDLALVDALVLVQAAEQKVPVKAVAAYYQRTPIILMSPKAKPVTDVKQLLGDVKVGAKKGSATYQGLEALLGANNIKIESIKVVDVGFNIQPLLVKQVDAIMGFTMNQPIEAESAGMLVYELPIADAGVQVYGLTIASNDEFIRNKPDLVSGFLRATRRAALEAAGAKQATLRALAKAVSEIDIAYEAKVLDRTLPFLTGKSAGFGAQTGEMWKRTADTAQRLGLVEKAPENRDLFNASLLK
jgi:NitT/TauT family transport system substrate-binding protein